MRHADLPDKAESGSDLAKALCSRIAPGPMMTQRAVANFGNGLDESLPWNATRRLLPMATRCV